MNNGKSGENIEEAKVFYDHEDEEPLGCDIDDCDGVMVKYENDKVCNECGYMYDTRPIGYEETTALSMRRWESFWDDRKDQSGFYGHDRVRFVGAVPRSRHDYSE